MTWSSFWEILILEKIGLEDVKQVENNSEISCRVSCLPELEKILAEVSWNLERKLELIPV